MGVRGRRSVVCVCLCFCLCLFLGHLFPFSFLSLIATLSSTQFSYGTHDSSLVPSTPEPVDDAKARDARASTLSSSPLDYDLTDRRGGAHQSD